MADSLTYVVDLGALVRGRCGRSFGLLAERVDLRVVRHSVAPDRPLAAAIAEACDEARVALRAALHGGAHAAVASALVARAAPFFEARTPDPDELARLICAPSPLRATCVDKATGQPVALPFALDPRPLEVTSRPALRFQDQWDLGYADVPPSVRSVERWRRESGPAVDHDDATWSASLAFEPVDTLCVTLPAPRGIPAELLDGALRRDGDPRAAGLLWAWGRVALGRLVLLEIAPLALVDDLRRDHPDALWALEDAASLLGADLLPSPAWGRPEALRAWRAELGALRAPTSSRPSGVGGDGHDVLAHLEELATSDLRVVYASCARLTTLLEQRLSVSDTPCACRSRCHQANDRWLRDEMGLTDAERPWAYDAVGAVAERAWERRAPTTAVSLSEALSALVAALPVPIDGVLCEERVIAAPIDVWPRALVAAVERLTDGRTMGARGWGVDGRPLAALREELGRLPKSDVLEATSVSALALSALGGLLLRLRNFIVHGAPQTVGQATRIARNERGWKTLALPPSVERVEVRRRDLESVLRLVVTFLSACQRASKLGLRPRAPQAMEWGARKPHRVADEAPPRDERNG